MNKRKRKDQPAQVIKTRKMIKLIGPRVKKKLKQFKVKIKKKKVNLSYQKRNKYIRLKKENKANKKILKKN